MKTLVLALVAVTVMACSGDDDGDDSTAPPAAATPTATAEAVAKTTPRPALSPVANTGNGGSSVPPVSTPSFVENGDVIGTFLEPMRTMVTHTASLDAAHVPDLEPWDRRSVVLYDLQAGTSTNFGPGLLVSFSSDFTELGYNEGGMLWVVDITTGEKKSFPSAGGLSTLLGEHYAVSPAGEGALLDLRTGERTTVQDIDEPELRYVVEQRLRPAGGALLDGGMVLRQADWNQAPCSDNTEAGRQRCMVEAFEQWSVEDLETGDVVLAFRALHAAAAGPGELVIATSPQCARPDGAPAWCEDVAAELRLTQDRAGNNPVYAEGTTNIFLVDIATGQAQFVATAAYRQHPFIWPQNWPVIANEDYVIWTEAYCGQPPGKTRIYKRASREITELDASLWVRWHGDHVGLGDFSSRGIFDPATLAYVAAVPDELSGVIWSSDFRYAAVGGVLGHGGLCG